MLDSKIIKKINDFVYIKPRTIQEIAHLLEKNWRTANSYVERIAEDVGSLSVRTFREGTRGALKIVFWNNIERIHSTSFQEKLFKKIESGRRKQDFSPFDIYQYIDKNKRDAFLEEQEDEMVTKKGGVINILKSAQNQIFIFSGNLSWTDFREGKEEVIKVFEEIAKNSIPIKILTKVDITSIRNTKKCLAINERIGKDIIEIRHCEQPLRCFVVDNKIARFKEIKEPKEYREGELGKKTFLFYNIYDEEWIEWLQKVFWNLFSTAIPAEKRVKDLETIQKLKI